MPYREFVDAAGETWQAWDVVPQREALQYATERRGRERGEGYAASDRRVESGGPPAGMPERRQSVDDRRVFGGTDMRHGWVAFLSRSEAAEHRRLAPIPPRWEEATEAELRGYLAAALPVRTINARRPVEA